MSGATIAEVFHVRNIFPDQNLVESGSYELEPPDEQARAVCELFQRYLGNRPAAFRDQLSILKHGKLELDWSAAPGGVALASLLQGSDVLSMSVLVAGAQPSADGMMLEVFRENVLSPLFGSCFDQVCECQERPLAVQVLFPGAPEWTPAVQLLSVALASVFFRAVRLEA
jgi:hypothetical protein